MIDGMALFPQQVDEEWSASHGGDDPHGNLRRSHDVRARVSATTMSMAPTRAEAGRRNRWSGPQIIRTTWGTDQATNPISPLTETTAR